MPMPPRPGGVAMATMVSLVENTFSRPLLTTTRASRYFRKEI
jgi:hypothetical protein